MAVKILWYLTTPDGPYPWEPEGRWKTDFEHLKQIAVASDRLGYYGSLLGSSPNESLDGVHVANFLDSIRLSKLPNADVAIGYKSTLWMQLGNIAQRVGHTLNIDQSNGHVLGDKKAMELWGRKYQPGWEPKV